MTHSMRVRRTQSTDPRVKKPLQSVALNTNIEDLKNDFIKKVKSVRETFIGIQGPTRE